MARKPKTPDEGEAPKQTAEQLNDDQLQVLFFQHKNMIGQRLAAKKKADAEFKNACKIAKAELGKNAVEDIKLAAELDTEEGEAILKDRIERQLRVARWMGASVGTQFAMFDEDRTPAADRAEAEGKRDGLEGKPRKCDYAPSTEQYRKYMAGYDKGQEQLGLKSFKAPAGEAAAGGEQKKTFAETMREQNDREGKKITEAANKIGTAKSTLQTVN